MVILPFIFQKRDMKLPELKKPNIDLPDFKKPDIKLPQLSFKLTEAKMMKYWTVFSIISIGCSGVALIVAMF